MAGAQCRVPLHELPYQLQGAVRVGRHSRTRHVGLELLGERAGIWIALGRGTPERALGDRGQLGRSFRTERSHGDRTGAKHRLHHLGVVCSLERRSPGQQLVEHRSQGEDVASLVDGLEVASRLLRAHVRRGSEGHPFLGQLRSAVGRGPRPPRLCLAAALGQPPVDDRGLAVRADHHVGRLEIAVDDRLTVCVRHGLGGVDQMRQQLEPLLHRPALGQRSLEGPTPHELLGRVERPVRAPRELVDGGDAGMIQLRGEPRLPEETGLGGGRARGGVPAGG
jgi:hypothetical protein